jgi:hypothetical protein
MRRFYIITVAGGTLLLALACLPTYGILSLLVILPVALFLLLAGWRLAATGAEPKPAYAIITVAGTFLLTLYCLPRYGVMSLLIVFPVALFLLLGSRRLSATAGEPAPAQANPTDAPPFAPASTRDLGISDVLARIAAALHAGGGQASIAEAESLRHEHVRCSDCGYTFVLSNGMVLGQPSPRRVPSAADREALYGYTIECPLCHKGGFVGVPIIDLCISNATVTANGWEGSG